MNRFNNKPKNKKHQYAPADDNPIEVARSIASDVAKDAAGLGRGIASDALEQLFASRPQMNSRDRVGEEQNTEKNQVIFQSADRIQRQTENIEKTDIIRSSPIEIKKPKEVEIWFHENQAIKRKIEQVRAELQKLIKDLNDLPIEIEKAVQEIPVDPGIYHLTFLERIKQFIKFLRRKISDSKTWLKLMNSKKKKKGYWAMFKKQGTKFAMSGERSIATAGG